MTSLRDDAALIDHHDRGLSDDRPTLVGRRRAGGSSSTGSSTAVDVAKLSSGGSEIANLKQTSLDRDMVFSDGYSLQLATVTGSVGGGYHAPLKVPI
jgi:hypothetical protein